MAAKKNKKRTSAKKVRTTKRTPSKKSTKKKASRKKVGVKRAAVVAGKIKPVAKKRRPPQKQALDRVSSSRPRRTEDAGDTDSRGLSEVEFADSESVGELVDEGNIFEAGVVSGVERAEDADEKEVRTREFSEDDVPEEYLDQD